MATSTRPRWLRRHARSFTDCLREFLTPALWKQAHAQRHTRRRASRWTTQPLVLVLLLMTWSCGDSQAERFYPASDGGPGTSGSIKEFGLNGGFVADLTRHSFSPNPTTHVTNFSPSVMTLHVGDLAPTTVSAGGSYTINEGGSLTLHATASDPNGAALTMYSWNVDGGDTFGEAVGKNPTLSWSRLAALGIASDGTASGVYSVRVMVRDADGQVVMSAPATVTVNYVPPVLSISGLSAANVNQTYTLQLSARDTFSDPVTSWTVTWGDGTSTTVQITNGKPTKVTHAYTEPGREMITATGDNGLATYDATDVVHVTVES